MKQLFTTLFLAMSIAAWAQLQPSKHSATFQLGNGLNVLLNNGDYHFRLSGMVQPYVGIQMPENQDAGYLLNSRRSYFNFYGAATREKVDFFIQLDYSQTQPLLDAWVGYHPTTNTTISIGQRQNIANNREMLLMEDQLQFVERSLLSTNFSATGREFGLFAEHKFTFGSFGIAPQVAVTSGDGRNSFGADSRDSDAGGLKYAARIDVYPLGFFKKGNDKMVMDLKRESSPKIVVGFAASKNDGASSSVGEGHKEFRFYDDAGNVRLPDYRKLYADILLKYRGFSLLGEYAVATAADLLGSNIDALGTPLLPTEISSYLALGTATHVQVGYLFPSGYGFDFRLVTVMPEFAVANSLVGEYSAWSLGANKFLIDNTCKLHIGYTSTQNASGNKMGLAEIMVQVVF